MDLSEIVQVTYRHAKPQSDCVRHQEIRYGPMKMSTDPGQITICYFSYA